MFAGSATPCSDAGAGLCPAAWALKMTVPISSVPGSKRLPISPGQHPGVDRVVLPGSELLSSRMDIGSLPLSWHTKQNADKKTRSAAVQEECAARRSTCLNLQGNCEFLAQDFSANGCAAYRVSSSTVEINALIFSVGA